MNERRMGRVILILLILLNLILFGYYLYQQLNESWVPKERIEQVKELYQKSGIWIQAEPEQRNQSYPILELGEANLDQMVKDVLIEPYEKMYIYGSKVQYISEQAVIVTDRKEHTISYQAQERQTEVTLQREVSVEEWARQQRITTEEAEDLMEKQATDFAHKWMGDDINLSKVEKTNEGYQYSFHAMRDEMVLYFNELQVCVYLGEVLSAELTYWEVTGEANNTPVLLPIDEILYAMLGDIRTELKEGEKDEVVKIMDGYQIEESEEIEKPAKAVPAIMVVMKSGREYVMNRTTL